MAAPHFSFFISVITQIFCLFIITLWLLWRVRELKLIKFPSYAKVHAEYHRCTFLLGFCICIQSVSFRILATGQATGTVSIHILIEEILIFEIFHIQFLLNLLSIRVLQVHCCFLSLLTSPASLSKEWVTNTNTADKNWVCVFFLHNTKSPKTNLNFFRLFIFLM